MKKFKDMMNENSIRINIKSLKDQYSDGEEQESDDFSSLFNDLKNNGLKDKDWKYDKKDDNIIILPSKFKKIINVYYPEIIS